MYFLLGLQIVIIILILSTIVLLIRKKWKRAIYSVSAGLIIFVALYFLSTSKTGLNYVFGYQHSIIESVPNSIAVDGNLDESFWDLQHNDLYLLEDWIQPDGKRTTSTAPSFQFMRDSTNIYFGCSFDTGIDTLNHIPPNNLYLSLRLKAHNSTLSHFRLAFAPFSDNGDASGYAFCDCSKCRLVSNYNFASQFNKGIWTFEFSIPFAEIMNPSDKYLMYKYTFINRLVGNEVGSYPAPEEGYKEYFIIG